MRRLRNLLGACSFLVAAIATSAAQPGNVVFRDLRIFDGERLHSKVTVVVKEGRIHSIGDIAQETEEAEVVSGSDLTLLPGLIDCHAHSPDRALLRQALMFGVTTTLHMFSDPSADNELRSEQAEGKASRRADLFSSGTGVTAPGGHGTQFGTPIPTLSDAADAQAFVDARIAEGSDYIKIILESGNASRTPPIILNTLSEQTFRAAVRAAQKRDKLAVVNASKAKDALLAVEAGADGLVHIFYKDGEPSREFARLAKARGVFIVPTLTVVESATGTRTGAALAGDARLAPYLRADQLESLRSTARPHPATNETYALARDTVRLLKDEGVPILAGSDCGNRGTAHGVSLHRELELLVQAGLTPLQALEAATSVAAKAFRLRDRGRIQPRLRADLLLVRGNPVEDILATREIVGVWKGGVAADRQAFRKELDDLERSTAPSPP